MKIQVVGKTSPLIPLLSITMVMKVSFVHGLQEFVVVLHLVLEGPKWILFSGKVCL